MRTLRKEFGLFSERASILESFEVVQTADATITDEDLGNSSLPVRSVDHLISGFPVARNVDLIEGNSFTFQKRLRGLAVWAKAGCVDGGALHHSTASGLVSILVREAFDRREEYSK